MFDHQNTINQQYARLSPQARQQLKAASALLVQADDSRFKPPVDLAKAAKLYKQVADMGNASGQFNYGQMILLGQVQGQPSSAALPWLLKAAAQEPRHPLIPAQPNAGVVEAWGTLGDLYRDGNGGVAAPDYAAALQWYIKAAEARGDPLAQNNIGEMYTKGRGVAVDHAAAVGWFERAAKQGYGAAEFNLAVLLGQGQPGVQQDLARALQLAKKASEHGVKQAAALIAALDADGSDAAKKLKLAAKEGDAAASLLLALAYHEGLHGLPK